MLAFGQFFLWPFKLGQFNTVIRTSYACVMQWTICSCNTNVATKKKYICNNDKPFHWPYILLATFSIRRPPILLLALLYFLNISVFQLPCRSYHPANYLQSRALSALLAACCLLLATAMFDILFVNIFPLLFFALMFLFRLFGFIERCIVLAFVSISLMWLFSNNNRNLLHTIARRCNHYLLLRAVMHSIHSFTQITVHVICK